MERRRTRTRIKICGLTRPEDVVAAVEVGADACGFIFAESPRRVGAEQAAALAALVPPPVARVGVFVDADLGFVEAMVASCGLSFVQFSGSESPEECGRVSVPVMKTMAVGMNFGVDLMEPYRGQAAAFLLDTYEPTRAGGTSRTFAWHSIGELPGWASVFVAGGLTEDNVTEAIHALAPFAVDVSSGVEVGPGVKDHSRIEAFCAAVRRADGEGGA